jgi:DNA-binding helix-hairpin-helix protein with protein kinase domain
VHDAVRPINATSMTAQFASHCACAYHMHAHRLRVGGDYALAVLAMHEHQLRVGGDSLISAAYLARSSQVRVLKSDTNAFCGLLQGDGRPLHN